MITFKTIKKSRITVSLFTIPIFRFSAALIMFFKAKLLLKTNRIYKATSDLCWIYRVTEINFMMRLALKQITNVIATFKKNENAILSSFLADRKSISAKNRYTLSGNGELYLFRDVIVLKSARPNEKGVILIKYAETYDAFLSFFDISKVFQRYFVVLEMSWAGACDPSFLMFINHQFPVIIQTPEKADYDFIYNLNTNLLPIKLGSSDWVDTEKYGKRVITKKQFDLIMVSNWSIYKRHIQLFKALKEINQSQIKLLLIGFPWDGRTRQNIEAEAQRHLGQNIHLTIKENLPHHRVIQYLRQSKVFLLLSKKEGGNKALMEALICDIPAIVYNKHKGGAREAINQQTGILSSYAELKGNILFMLENYRRFSPNKWVLKNTGSKNSTEKLNQFIRKIAIAQGEEWNRDISEKVNSPNLMYKKDSDKEKYQKDFNFLTKILRK